MFRLAKGLERCTSVTVLTAVAALAIVFHKPLIKGRLQLLQGSIQRFAKNNLIEFVLLRTSLA